MNILLIRHGETDHNRGGITLGRADIALNTTGEQQAAALGERLALTHIDRLYASPLARARSTADAIAAGRPLEVEVREELIEMDVGATENLTSAELREQFPEFLAEWGGPEPASVTMPGGESLSDVDARIGTFVPELVTAGAATVAVVSHNFVIKLLLCRLLAVSPNAFRTFSVDVASVTTLVMRGERITLRSLNDSCHLHHLSFDPGDRSV